MGDTVKYYGDILAKPHNTFVSRCSHNLIACCGIVRNLTVAFSTAVAAHLDSSLAKRESEATKAALTLPRYVFAHFAGGKTIRPLRAHFVRDLRRQSIQITRFYKPSRKTKCILMSPKSKGIIFSSRQTSPHDRNRGRYTLTAHARRFKVSFSTYLLTKEVQESVTGNETILEDDNECSRNDPPHDGTIRIFTCTEDHRE